MADVGKYRLSARCYQPRESGGMPALSVEFTLPEGGRESRETRDEEEPTCLLNMHRPNGTGRGRDKGRLIFPVFNFLPSLFYFRANRYRRWSSFFLLSRLTPFLRIFSVFLSSFGRLHDFQNFSRTTIIPAFATETIRIELMSCPGETATPLTIKLHKTVSRAPAFRQ